MPPGGTSGDENLIPPLKGGGRREPAGDTPCLLTQHTARETPPSAFGTHPP
jgi:hypothetical protein